jgi:RsiW-degrading membrane proteinase PrsW (M82 family)
MSDAAAWLVSITAAVIPTVGYVLILWWFDRYEKEPRHLLWISFVWGAVPAILLSLVAESFLGQPLGALSESTAELMSSSVVAPIVEEIAKGLAVLILFLFLRREFDDVLDGIVYGATIGFGFAMTENAFYFMHSLSNEGTQGLTLVVFLRSFIFGLNHALFSSVFGAALGYARMAKTGCSGWLVAPLGLLGAMILHAVHNLFATLANVTCFSLLFSLFSDWGGVLVIFVVMALAWQQEKRWIATHLQAEVASGLLTQEQLDTISSYRRRLAAQWQAWGRGGRRAARQVGLLAQLATELAFKVEQGDEPMAERLRVQIAALLGLPTITVQKPDAPGEITSA